MDIITNVEEKKIHILDKQDTLLSLENKIIEQKDTCSICLLAFDEEKNKTLSCQHKFHTSCIDQWLIQSSSCPLCRRNISANDLPDVNPLTFSQRIKIYLSDVMLINLLYTLLCIAHTTCYIIGITKCDMSSALYYVYLPISLLPDCLTWVLKIYYMVSFLSGSVYTRIDRNKRKLYMTLLGVVKIIFSMVTICIYLDNYAFIQDANDMLKISLYTTVAWFATQVFLVMLWSCVLILNEIDDLITQQNSDNYV